MTVKDLSVCFIVVVILSMSLQIAIAADPEESLVLYFPFSEGMGTVVTDSSPNGFEANLEGNYEWVHGRSGGAIEFKGGSAVIPDDDRLDVEQITVMAWIFPNTITPENTGEHWTGCNLIYDKSGSSDDSVVLALRDEDGAFFYLNSGPGGNKRMGPFDGADVNNTLDLPDMGIQTSKWQHIAGTFDGENIRIYLDGELAGEMLIAGDNPSIIWNDNNGGIGGRQGSILFDGIIDEFALFDRALDEDEIGQMMMLMMAVELVGKLTSTWGVIKGRL